jgi:mannose-6-phosphate isomerase-like protein (cupin superfamily)
MEIISVEGTTFAIIIRSNFVSDKIQFVTSNNMTLQLGYLPHKKGGKIEPHYHLANERVIFDTLEVLFVRKGKVKVNFYSEKNEFVTNTIISAQDSIILISGGHGFEILEETELIEVKQGPYSEREDKVRFKGIEQ